MSICSGCGEGIESQDLLQAFGMQYHNYCLCCNVCQKDFSDRSACREGSDGYAYCEKDFLRTFGHKCGRCNEYIFGQMVEALNKKWHPDHFTCNICKKDVSLQFYASPEGQPLCEKHYYEVHNLICQGCDQPIVTSRVVNIEIGKFHPEHFQCDYCKTNLVGKAFKVHKAKVYDTKCFNNLFG